MMSKVRSLLSKGNYYRKCLGGTPVIVFQMGKVGSRSICDSLDACNIKPVFHVHRLNPATPLPWQSERLYADIIRSGRKAKVITLVREPVSRNISHFFRIMSVNRILDVAGGAQDISMEELYNNFIEKVTYHWTPLVWLDEELKPVLGVDIYATPFPKEKGYEIIKRGTIELLVLKLEVDDSVKEKAISEFLGVDGFRLRRSNTATTNNYSDVYRHFRENVVLPEAYVRFMYDSDYVKHFYTEDEVGSFRGRWSTDGSLELPQALHRELSQRASRSFQ